MNLRTLFTVPVILAGLSISALAETTVTLSDVHLCCGNCVRGVDTALKDMSSVKATCDQAAKTVAITAPDTATAQKAVDALVMAGYYGKSSDSSIKVEASSGAKDGKVQTLDVAGVHLCCAKCVTAVKDVLGKVDGVTGNNVAQRATMFNVTGNFSASSLFEELNKAGLAGRVAITPAASPAHADH